MIRLTPGAVFGSDLTRRVARNAVFTLIGRTWYVVLWFVVTPYVLRSLGQERFGVWSLLFLLSAYLTTFDLGLGAALIKFAAEHASRSDWERLRGTTARALRVYGILGAVWVVAVVLLQTPLLHWLRISPPFESEVRFALISSAAIFAAANLVGTGVGVLNGLQRMDLANGILVAVSIPQMLVLLLGLGMGYGLRAVVASTFVQWSLTFLLVWAALRKVAPQIAWPSLRGQSQERSWWSFSAAVQVNAILAITQQQVDKVLLTTITGVRSVTEFELGFRVANAIQSLPVLLLNPLLPAFVELRAAGEEERLRYFMARCTRWVAGASFAASAACVPAAPFLIVAWVGKEHAVAEGLAPWLLGGLAISLMTGVTTVAGRAAGRPDLELVPAVAGVLVHISASWFGLSRYGASAVGPAFAIAMVVWAVSYLAVFTRWSRIPFRATVGPQLAPLLASLVGGFVAWRCGGDLSGRLGFDRLSRLEVSAATGCIGLAVYFLTWWILERVYRRGAGSESARGGAPA